MQAVFCPTTASYPVRDGHQKSFRCPTSPPPWLVSRSAGNLADARVLASADPFLSKRLNVLRKRNHVCSVRREYKLSLAPRPSGHQATTQKRASGTFARRAAASYATRSSLAPLSATLTAQRINSARYRQSARQKYYAATVDLALARVDPARLYLEERSCVATSG